ncbi:phosphatidylinositol 4,5-bisphosphate 3-kinase catalytic subunit delta isoform-like [Leptodactylus fuscus]|uniref:phosphatidylinositol 4,5-bisphosphate 3-kinase catalytic subunit delta isoform-like n=1 Tax=Leptodactylus fuscus TaxID=238119 RepID=UPI003F4EC48F
MQPLGSRLVSRVGNIGHLQITELGGRNTVVIVTPEEQQEFEEKMNQKPQTEYRECDRELIWKFRHEIRRRYPENLARLLLLTRWSCHVDVAQMIFLLMSWPDISMSSVLELLSSRFPDPYVEMFVVRCLRGLPNEHLSSFLLPFVQVLKTKPYIYNNLSKFLLERALTSRRIGQQLFWLLRSEMDDPSVTLHFSIILDIYCRTKLCHSAELVKQVPDTGRIPGHQVPDSGRIPGHQDLDTGRIPGHQVPDTGRIPGHQVPDSGRIPGHQVPDTGRIPGHQVPDTGRIPGHQVPDSGRIPGHQDLDTGRIPGHQVPDTGRIPGHQVPDTGRIPGHQVPDSGRIPGHQDLDTGRIPGHQVPDTGHIPGHQPLDVFLVTRYQTLDIFLVTRYQTLDVFLVTRYQTLDVFLVTKHQTLCVLLVTRYQTLDVFPTTKYQTLDVFPTTKYQTLDIFLVTRYQTLDVFLVTKHQTLCVLLVTRYQTLDVFPTTKYQTLDVFPTTKYQTLDIFLVTKHQTLDIFLVTKHQTLDIFLVQAVDKMKSLNDFVQASRMGKPETRAALQERLMEESSSLSHLCCPLDSRLFLKDLCVERCTFMQSKTKPLLFVYRTDVQGGNEFGVIYKSGDDLRQDMLVLNLIKIMDHLWKVEGLDLRMVPYGCVTTAAHTGLIEALLNSETIANIQLGSGRAATAAFSREAIFNWLQMKNPGESLQGALEEFTLSCAGYCVATYVLGIGDRHSDNIMIQKTGQMFHIDFGHILGKFKSKFGIRRERTPFILTSDFLHVIQHGRAHDESKFSRFQCLCDHAYSVLRTYRTLLLNVVSLMEEATSTDPNSALCTQYMKDSLAIGLSDDDALKNFRIKFDAAIRDSWKTKLNWWVHNLARDNR